MATFVPPQLTSIIGNDLDAIDEATLKELLGIAEGDVLEYKSDHYGASDGQKRELATDIAGFANAAGALLIVGMDEDDDTGEATELAPLHIQPHGVEEDTRYRQIIASNIFPHVDINTHRVDLAEGSVLVVSIPPSPLRPHAVYRDGSLRYPVRVGRTRRWLHEWEVADAYRQRFDGAQAAAARADEVRAQAVDLLNEIMAGGDDADATGVWLVMALSPDRVGHLRIDHDTVDATREWASRMRTVPIEFLVRALTPTAGFRAIHMTDQTGSYRHNSRMALTLTSTGAAAGAIRLDHDARQTDFRDPTLILDVWLFLGALALGELLAAHAINRCGTGGTATALINLNVAGQDTVALADNRRFTVDQLGSTLRQPASTPVGRRTVALDDMWPPSPGLVSTCVGMLSDVTGPFGLPTPYQADRDGRIRRRYVENGIIEPLRRWADEHGIEVTDDTAGG